MKCRICASECPPGAKICRDCAAARKRAFAATVTQPLLAAVGAPSVSQARFAPRPARSKAAGKPSVRAEAASVAPAPQRSQTAPPRGSNKWLLLGAAIVIAVAIIIIKVIASGNQRTSVAADAQQEGTETTSAPVPGETALKAPSANPTQSERRSAPTAGFSQADEGAPKKATHRSAASKTPATVEAPMPLPAEPSAAPKVDPAAAAPRAPAPRVAEAPRDPWQAMNEGLARCAREDFFSRAGCEQKLRLQYCANYWGTVPQCPIGPATDHGQ
jgi:hypothetical protein